MMTPMKPEPQYPLWRRIRGATAGYADGIVRLIGELYGIHTIQTAWSEYNVRTHRPFECADPDAELFFSWLFHCWSPTRSKPDRLNDRSLYGVSPTRAYLDRHRASLDPILRRYLETCLATSPSFYEVRNCVPTEGFRACDVMTGAEREVGEEIASTTLADGDIIFAHLISIEEATVLEAISPVSLPPRMKRRLIRMSRSRQSSVPAARQELRELYFSLSSPRQCGRAVATR
jgi:hypothetical protein